MINHSFCNLQYSSPLGSFLLVFLLISPTINSISFELTRFDPADATIIYEGDATPKAGAIEFNSIPYYCQVGRAVYAEKVPIWDSKTKKLSDFTTHFSFLLNNTPPSTSLGSGIAFFLAPVSFRIPPNSAAGFLGLYNITTSFSNQNKIVHVEFDASWNEEWDPPRPLTTHVGINRNSISSANYTSWNASLHRGDTADVWISYNSSNKFLSVSWKYQQNPTSRASEESTSLSYKVDLREVLPEWVIIGITAAKGNTLSAKQLLLSWDFSSNLEMSEPNGKTDGQKKLALGLAVPGGGVVIAVMILMLVFLHRRKSMRRGAEETTNLTSINVNELERKAGPRRFSHRDLVLATNNFSEERRLGAGGFGAVYKGYLSDLDAAVAVKRISKDSKQGKKEYITEVKTISQLRHRNLVQLLGWCHDTGDFLLIYEFMPNGSLDTHLFGKKVTLNWAVRYRIALGLASALLYLHEEWEQCVLHRDVKSSNIMLDSSFNVKLGDFGLARLIDHGVVPQPTGLAGTRGYMAPEYINTGRASREADVYSFGVVALEIATGRKAVGPGESEMSLVEWVWDLYGRGKLRLAIDKRLHSDFDEKQVECLMIVGLWCAHPDHSLRPSMRQAIQVLNFDIQMPNLPSKMSLPNYQAATQPSTSSAEPLMTCSSLEIGR